VVEAAETEQHGSSSPTRGESVPTAATVVLCPRGYAAVGPASFSHARHTHNTAATIRAEGRAAFVRSIHRVGMQTDQAVTASSYATPSRALTAGSRRESATGAPHAQEGLAVAILLRPRGTRRLASFGSRGTRPSATAAPCGRARRCPADACGGGDVQGRMRYGIRETAASLFVCVRQEGRCIDF
jgi:hypothetical protein